MTLEDCTACLAVLFAEYADPFHRGMMLLTPFSFLPVPLRVDERIDDATPFGIGDAP